MLAGAAWVALALAGCAAGPRVVGADVRTHAAVGPGAAVLSGASYRFVRGPWLAGQPAPERLEALARPALARVGLVAAPDDGGAAITAPQAPQAAAARVSVELGGVVSTAWMYDGWASPGWMGPGRFAFGLGGGGWGLGLGWPMLEPAVPVYVTEASVLMRDVASGQIVYDTRARHSGTSQDSDNVLAALFVAALEGYPQPGAALRRVDVPLIPLSRDVRQPLPAASGGASTAE